MKEKTPFIHRDISWLAFNYRVLQEAKDSRVPLFEKIKFLAIYSSNLGEFFKVRVANHKNLLRLGKDTKKALFYNSGEILEQILSIVNKQQEEFSQIFRKIIIPQLTKNNIQILRRKDLNEEQQEFVESYFNDHLIPLVQPVLLMGDKVKPFLVNGELYLSLIMESRDNEQTINYALVRIPSDIYNRYVVLPSSEKKRNDIILLDDIIRYTVRNIFPGFKVLDTYSIKITRDAELYIDDEYTGDLLEKIKKSLSKRNIGPASRMVYDRKMPKHLLNYLIKALDLEDTDLLPEGRYHNNFDLFKFPSFGLSLVDKKLPPLDCKVLTKSKSIFTEIAKQDHFLHVPYHDYEPVVRFFEQAAEDKKVTHIRIVQYRVAKISRIMNALIKASKSGKIVTAFIEIKARFDEEANLIWGEKLSKAGVKVTYSMPGIKVHCKIAQVCRNENGKDQYYSFLSTGNFHEGTATLYSDMGIFTSDPRLNDEIVQIFSYLGTKVKPDKKFKYLGVGSFNLKEKLIAHCEREIKMAKKGKKACITLKMNSLQDSEMIQLLYKASQEGVEVRLIIRGICCLVSQVKGISDNINSRGVVDRFLEHARVFIFHNNGKEDIFLSSADWMVRNLHYRVETLFPIYDKNIKKYIIDLIDLQLADNVKARSLDFKNINSYIRNDQKKLRSQEASYYYLAEKQ